MQNKTWTLRELRLLSELLFTLLLNKKEQRNNEVITWNSILPCLAQSHTCFIFYLSPHGRYPLTIPQKSTCLPPPCHLLSQHLRPQTPLLTPQNCPSSKYRSWRSLSGCSTHTHTHTRQVSYNFFCSASASSASIGNYVGSVRRPTSTLPECAINAVSFAFISPCLLT